MTNHEIIRLQLMEYMMSRTNSLENDVRVRYNRCMYCKGDELDYFELILAMSRLDAVEAVFHDIHGILTHFRRFRLPKKDTGKSSGSESSN